MSQAAHAQAKRLGRGYVGPVHGLLAILRGDPSDVARRALEAAGLEADQFEPWWVDKMEHSDPSAKPRTDGLITFNPAWHDTAGRAEGLAFSTGHSDVHPVDFLIAMLWDVDMWVLVSWSWHGLTDRLGKSTMPPGDWSVGGRGLRTVPG